MSESKTSVPKFGSFRPKPEISSSVLDQGEKDRVRSRQHDKEDKRRQHDSEGKSRHEHHRPRKSHSKERRRDTSNERHPSSKHRQLVETNAPAACKEEIEELFIIDRKGDVKNLVYGSVHRYSVPPFHRVGAGNVLGLPSFVRIDRAYGDEKGIILNDRRYFKSIRREKYIFSELERERPRLLKIRQGITAEESPAQSDYVSVHISRGKKRKRCSGDETSGSEGETNYRSIHGKAKPKEDPEDEILHYATESDFSGSETGRTVELDAGVRQKTVELSRKVNESPRDVQAWLALIDHQDVLIRGDQRRVTNAELRSTADIKIHM